ncbi:hypothetical protein Tco_1291330, partial [Tanacetum coccineum]
MLAQQTKDEGAVSERPSEIQPTPSHTHPSEDQSEPQPDPFLIPSSSNPLPDSIPNGSGGNHGDQEYLHEEKIGKEEVFEDKVDAKGVWDSEETRVSFKEQVSTDRLKVSIDKPNEGTAKPNEGTAEPKDGNSDESDAPTTICRDDEIIAQFLVTMSQNKTKQKGFEIKEIKDTNRPRTTTERSILTLKPLPKIDPKDKVKKVLEEKAESDAESEGVNKVKRKFAQLANEEEISRKVQEEWE